jgi:hypothetical protein
MARRPGRPKLVRRLEDASTVVGAAGILLGQTAGMLGHMAGLIRQLVMIVGWLVLLTGSVRLLLDPPPARSPEVFLAPGAGAAAVAQGLVRLPAGRARSRLWKVGHPHLADDGEAGEASGSIAAADGSQDKNRRR